MERSFAELRRAHVERIRLLFWRVIDLSTPTWKGRSAGRRGKVSLGTVPPFTVERIISFHTRKGRRGNVLWGEKEEQPPALAQRPARGVFPSDQIPGGGAWKGFRRLFGARAERARAERGGIFVSWIRFKPGSPRTAPPSRTSSAGRGAAGAPPTTCGAWVAMPARRATRCGVRAYR